MLREKLFEEYVTLKKSSTIIARENNLRKNRIDYLLKKFNIPTRSIQEARKPKLSKNIPGYKWCPSCSQDLRYSYFHKNKLKLTTYCKQCSAKKSKRYTPNQTESRQRFKALIIKMFGNICAQCSLGNLPIACYTFHHHSEKKSDPSYITPARIITTKNITLVKQEMKKWQMLCWNCHTLTHNNCKLTATELT